MEQCRFSTASYYAHDYRRVTNHASHGKCKVAPDRRNTLMPIDFMIQRNWRNAKIDIASMCNAVATRTDFLVRGVARRRRAFRGLKTSSEEIGRVVWRVRKACPRSSDNTTARKSTRAQRHNVFLFCVLAVAFVAYLLGAFLACSASVASKKGRACFALCVLRLSWLDGS